MTETYRAIYELDTNKWWFVHIDELPGCHTHGGNLAAARRNIFEAAAALLDVDESELVIEADVRLPAVGQSSQGCTSTAGRSRPSPWCGASGNRRGATRAQPQRSGA